MSEVILGIDLGTTHSAVGVVESGFPILLANESGKRIMPSAVWFGEDEVEVGEKALRRRGVDPVVTSVKRLMGRKLHEVEDFPLECTRGEGGGVRVLGRSPEEVSAEILRELKRIAEWRLETEVHKAVITVPAYFNEGQRAATKRAGELAGLEVVRIINEPTAAALAYGLDRLDDRSRVAVYDFGGGTFDLSILEMQDGVFQVLSTHGDTRLGGDDLDVALWQWVAEKCGLPAEPGPRELAEAERVKRALSDRSEEVFRLPFAESGNVELAVSREDFERIAAPILERTMACCKRALSDADLTVEELDAVVLVGGSTRIPAVRDRVERLFGRSPDLSQHPDEAIALGATIQAGVMSGAMRQVVLLDVTPLSLGIETFGGLMNVLIPRNTTIPCKAGEMFTNAVAGQRSMKIRVLQGEREMARDNWPLGDFEVAFETAEKGRARVGVQFRIDESGLLEVLARDVATGVDTVVEIDSAAVDVDDDRVEQMVSESVEHAFDDMAERIFTEARLKAEELLKAVDAVMAQGDGLVTDEEAAEIRRLSASVEEAMEKGEPNPLKAAVQALDQATEGVAARLVEKAMEESLMKKLGD
ncbi:Hsp70 family protein [Haloferula rosea]|uniref:Hsp70 family protein n=1 Tax=Haloferula rosea TaxID=490093 RepID=A0A934RF66_9BACT|nr:Hsp70 family protein [Haloferula rosea]MBK1827280.1 Hsp70 family protein [Haloferula rosea]